LAALTGVMMGPLSRIPTAQKGTSHEKNVTSADKLRSARRKY
jgi:hypothetical protein